MEELKHKLDTLFRTNIADWTDTDCEFYDSVCAMSCKVLRAAMQELRKVREFSLQELKKAYGLYEELRKLVLSGRLAGYQIKCPNCGVEYTVLFEEFNGEGVIKCMDCGHEYQQKDNIIGVLHKEDN